MLCCSLHQLKQVIEIVNDLFVCSAMDARQFHHQHHPVTSLEDVIDLCVDDVMKQEPPRSSPREPGISPHQPVTMTTTSGTVDDDGQGYVSFRLDQDDSGGSSGGSGVQPVIYDPDVAAAADLCLSDALRLPCVPGSQRTDAGSPSESDMYSLSAAPPGTGGSVPRTSPGQCKVCGDEATGMYFGALVCVPCKV